MGLPLTMCLTTSTCSLAPSGIDHAKLSFCKSHIVSEIQQVCLLWIKCMTRASLTAEPGEMDAPPTAVCSAAGVNLLWTMYGLHRLSFSGDKLLMTKVPLSFSCTPCFRLCIRE